MRKLFLKDGKIIINCSYDPAVIYQIKQIPGRTYDTNVRLWSVPVLFINELLVSLKPLGFELSPEIEELAAPAPKRAIKSDLALLFGYQRTGVEFLMNTSRALLGDDMGSGKGVTAITACEELGLNKVLVITLASLKWAFESEVKKWYPESPTQVINGRANERDAQYQADAKYFILNYELARQDLETLSIMDWDAIICDEATKISNPKAKVSKAIKLLAGLPEHSLLIF